MADGLSLRAFGKRLDVTGEAVRKAIAEGKIPADCVGERRVGKGNTVWPVITDPERAAAHWNRNRDPNQVRDKATMSAGAKRGWVQRKGGTPPPEDDQDDDDLDEPQASPRLDRAGGVTTAGGKPGEPSITDYKRITEAYKARTAKVEYEQLTGMLVPAALIEAKYVGLMTALRNRLLGVPSEAKSEIPHLTVDEIEILEGLIVAALEEVASEDDDDDGD